MEKSFHCRQRHTTHTHTQYAMVIKKNHDGMKNSEQNSQWHMEYGIRLLRNVDKRRKFIYGMSYLSHVVRSQLLGSRYDFNEPYHRNHCHIPRTPSQNVLDRWIFLKKPFSVCLYIQNTRLLSRTKCLSFSTFCLCEHCAGFCKHIDWAANNRYCQ